MIVIVLFFIFFLFFSIDEKLPLEETYYQTFFNKYYQDKETNIANQHYGELGKIKFLILFFY